MVDAELAGMASYLVISMCVVAAFTLWLTMYYARPGTTIHVIGSTWFSWFFTFISVWILLPLDLLNSSSDFFYSIWQFVYWISFINTWIILPVHQTYAEAGEFTVGGRLWSSIKFNLKFYIVAGVFLVGFIMYIAIKNQFSKSQLVGFILCMANTWGLCLGILLLGYGLVEVPRRLWHNGNKDVQLRRIQYQAAAINGELEDCKDKLADAMRMVREISGKIKEGHPLRKYVEIISANLPTAQEIDITTARRLQDFEESSLHQEIKKEELDVKILAKVHFYVKAATRNYGLAVDSLADAVDRAIDLEQIIETKAGNSPPVGRSGFFRKILFRYRVHIEPFVTRIFAVLSALISLFFAWGEMVIYHPDLSPIAHLMKGLGNSGGAVFFGTILILYLSICAFFALFQLRIHKFYQMQYNRRTDENSILFNAALMLRLPAPLGFNFCQLANIKGTVFQSILGGMDVVPFFGDSFTVYFPIFIGIFCVGTLFNVYGYLMKFLGVTRFEYKSSFSDDNVSEGAGLIRKEKRRRGLPVNDRPSVSTARIRPARKPQGRGELLLEDNL